MLAGRAKQLAALAASPFRRRFKLSDADHQLLDRVGQDGIRRHVRALLAARIGAASPVNDGRQTPMRGHPVFVAQHATATCCRDCLAKWHRIGTGYALSEIELAWLVELLLCWIEREHPIFAPMKPAAQFPLL